MKPKNILLAVLVLFILYFFIGMILKGILFTIVLFVKLLPYIVVVVGVLAIIKWLYKKSKSK